MENSTVKQTEESSSQESVESREEVIPFQENNQEMSEKQKIDNVDRHIKGVIEALLFISEKPVTLEQFKKVLETVSGLEIKNIIGVLSKEYEERKSGMTIVEIAGGHQMLSNSTYASYVRDFYKTKHKERLSKPALESLAIIAYKQPVTRSDIELIRGVNSDGVVNHLLNKELIKTIGRKDVPGRPFLYGTTKQFMEYFGLKSLNDLPKLEEFPSLLPAEDKEEEDRQEKVNNEPGEEQKVQEEIAEEVKEISETVSIEEGQNELK